MWFICQIEISEYIHMLSAQLLQEPAASGLGVITVSWSTNKKQFWEKWATLR